MAARDSISAKKQTPVEYRIVGDFPNYRVGSDGSVWSKASGQWRRLKRQLLTNGYPYVTLYKPGLCSGRKCLVSRLVLEAFVGPAPKRLEARHFPDRNPLNNNIDNLRWGTHRENMNDKVFHKTQPHGEQMPWAVVTSQIARELREEYAVTSLTISDLARKHGLHRDVVYGVISGRNWRRAGGPIPTSNEMVSRRPIGKFTR